MIPNMPHIVCLIIALLAVPAFGQSESELRNENQVLKTQVRELTVELKAARETIQQLRDEIAALKAQLAAARTGGIRPPSSTEPDREPEPEVVTIDESVPNASPRALLAALRSSYNERFESMDMGEGPGRERSVYLRAVETWQRGVNREFRSKIEWHVRALEVSPRAVRLVAVDPETDVRLGEPFTVYLRRSVAGHFENLHAREGDAVYFLRGVLQPEVAVKPTLDRQPTFGETTFIGPFAEYGYTVDVQSLTLVEVPPSPDEQGTTPSGRGRP